MTQLEHHEVVERICKAMQQMDGQELADLYNREFGEGMEYVGDDLFEQALDPDSDELCEDDDDAF